MVECFFLQKMLSERFFHDVSNSVGVIFNCLNLITMNSNDISNKAKFLAIKESDSLIKKIKIFRLFYTSDSKVQINLPYFREVFKYFYSNGNKLKLDLRFESGVLAIENLLAKVSICLLIIISEISSSEEMSIDYFFGKDSKNNNLVKVIVLTKDLKLTNKIYTILSVKRDEKLSVGNCLKFYIYSLCKKAGYKISTNKKTNSCEYNFIKVI